MSVTEFKKETPLFFFLDGEKDQSNERHLFIIAEKENLGNTYSNNKKQF